MYTLWRRSPALIPNRVFIKQHLNGTPSLFLSDGGRLLFGNTSSFRHECLNLGTGTEHDKLSLIGCVDFYNIKDYLNYLKDGTWILTRKTGPAYSLSFTEYIPYERIHVTGDSLVIL